MRVSFKTIKNQLFNIEIENNEITIEDLKFHIYKSQGFEKSSITLIYNGIVLDNNQNLKKYHIQENSQLTCLISKSQPKNLFKSTLIKLTKEEQEKIEQYLHLFKVMGYSKEESEKALVESNYNFQDAVDILEKDLEDYCSDTDSNDDSDTSEFDKYSDKLNKSRDFKDYDEISEDTLIDNCASIIKVKIRDDLRKFKDTLVEILNKFPHLSDVIKNNYNELTVLVFQPITKHDIEVYKKYSEKSGYHIYPVDSDSESEEEFKNDFSEKDEEIIQRMSEHGYSHLECKKAYLKSGKKEEIAISMLLKKRKIE